MARILLIDDEASILQSISMLLASDEHKVTAIRSSEKAVDIIKNGDYDILITDIRMAPVDGMEILKLAHDYHPEKPTIVVSAYSSDDTIQDCMDHGCVAYIKKPFKIHEVQDAVDVALKKQAALTAGHPPTS